MLLIFGIGFIKSCLKENKSYFVNVSSKRAEIKVVGSVQGVFFRAGVKAEAERLGLSGWARNEPDGTVNPHTKRALRFARIFFCARYGVGVKIMAEGEEESLQKIGGMG